MDFFLNIFSLVFIEILFRIYETKALDNTAVSNIKETNYKSSKIVIFIRAAVPVITAFIIICSIYSGKSLGFILAFFFTYIFTRAYIYNIFINAAKSSIAGRLSEVFSREEFNNPSFLFYFSAPDLSEPAHVTMWIDPLSSLDKPWFVILRERKHLAYFMDPKRPNAVLIEKDNHLNNIYFENHCLIFYANNCQKNRSMLSKNINSTHIQLLHGDSDKPPSYSPLSKNYDYLFVAGQMAIDRYIRHGVNIPDDKFKIIGRPQVKSIEPSINSNGDIRSLGYMPTWKGFFEDTQFSSLDRASDIIKIAQKSIPAVKLIFKPHPMSSKDSNWKKIKKSAVTQLSRNGRISRPEETPFDIYNASDLLITDISSVMIDFLYSGKPLIVILPKNFDESGSWRYPSLSAAYLVDADLKNLDEIITIASTTDPLKSKRLKIREDAFGDTNHPPGEIFTNLCLDMINNRQRMSDND